MDLMMIFPRRMNAVGKAVTMRYLKDTRLKAHHMMILAGIGSSGGASQKGLAECLPYDKSYISTGVRDLIEMGYVRNDAEGKVHELHLTDSGKEIHIMCDLLFDTIQKDLLSVLDPEEREMLRKSLQKIYHKSDEIIDSYTKGS